jgi:hypothetical protein
MTTSAVVFTWVYTPIDYFDLEREVEIMGCKVVIQAGKVEARVDALTHDVNLEFEREFHSRVRAYFLVAQLAAPKLFDLSDATPVRIDTDGRRHYVLRAATGHLKLGFGPVDYVYTRADGTVVDSKAERRAKEARMANLISNHAPRNSALATMLEHHGEALRNQEHELIHLYKIRDTLIHTFPGKDVARRKLKLSKTMWERFGEICCDKTLRQGRHGGSGDTPMRDASDAELKEVRDIARAMLVAFVEHLEGELNNAGT